MYFPKHRLAVEIDEKDTLTEIKKRERSIKEKLGCKFIRINCDEKDYDEYVNFG